MIFERSVLPNGARLISENIEHVKSISVGFWVGVGSRDESKEVAGISHFLEHLLFKGTKNYTAKEIAEIFDSMGGELNAFSSKEFTCFYARFLDAHLEKAMDILSDMFLYPQFSTKDFNAEREVVLEEINMYEDTPDDMIHDIVASSLLEHHPLGNRVLGEAKAISLLKKSDINYFFKQHYLPKSLVIAAAGNLEHETLRKTIVSRFDSKWPVPPQRHLFEPQVVPKQIFTPKQTEQYHIALAWKGLPRSSKDRFTASVIDNVLGGGMSSRLFQEIREKKGLAYSVYSYHLHYADTGLMVIYAGCRENKVREVIRLTLNEIGKLVKSGVTPQELQRSKEHIKGSLVLNLENTSNRMSRLGKAELCRGEILSIDEVVNRIDAVTVEDVRRVAPNILDPNNYVIAVIGPREEVMG